MTKYPGSGPTELRLQEEQNTHIGNNRGKNIDREATRCQV